MDLPDDVIVEPRVVNGEPEVFLSIEGTTFHLRPDDASKIGFALVSASHSADAAHRELTRDSE
jgi:hypothetical protein